MTFENSNPQSLRFVFTTLQACMIEVIKRKGSFDYHIPHMNKTKQAREGTLPDYFSVDKVLVVDSLQHLLTKMSIETINELVQIIGFQGDVQVSEPQFEVTQGKINMDNNNQTAS